MRNECWWKIVYSEFFGVWHMIWHTMKMMRVQTRAEHNKTEKEKEKKRLSIHNSSTQKITLFLTHPFASHYDIFFALWRFWYFPPPHHRMLEVFYRLWHIKFCKCNATYSVECWHTRCVCVPVYKVFLLYSAELSGYFCVLLVLALENDTLENCCFFLCFHQSYCECKNHPHPKCTLRDSENVPQPDVFSTSPKPIQSENSNICLIFIGGGSREWYMKENECSGWMEKKNCVEGE